jgi:hypothetical protein
VNPREWLDPEGETRHAQGGARLVYPQTGEIWDVDFAETQRDLETGNGEEHERGAGGGDEETDHSHPD